MSTDKAKPQGCLTAMVLLIALGFGVKSLAAQIHWPWARQEQVVSLTRSATVGGLQYELMDARTDSTVSGITEQHALGEYIVLQITVSNVGTNPAEISSHDFNLKSGDSTYAPEALLSEGDFFLSLLNPGNTRSGRVVFDVPRGTERHQYQLQVFGNDSTDSSLIGLF